MKNSKSKMELQFISIVIPILNGSYAKLLSLTVYECRKLKKTSSENIGKISEIFALYSNSNHDVLLDDTVWLTRKQFDELLKNNYNSKFQFGRNRKVLKSVED
jgi:hypothetical protein